MIAANQAHLGLELGALSSRRDAYSTADPSLFFFPRCRLLDIIHSDAMLCLIFEFLDLDLKRYMDAASAAVPLGMAGAGTVTDQGTGVPNAKGKGRARRGLPNDLVAVSPPFLPPCTASYFRGASTNRRLILAVSPPIVFTTHQKLLSQLLLGLSHLHSRFVPRSASPSSTG